MALRTRNQALLAKIETTEGVDAAPVPGTDAVLIENLQHSYNPNIIQTNEHTGSLDSRGPIAGGMTVQVTFDVFLKGSGAPGTAPEWGKLLRACGWAETITSTAIPAAPESCAAGGTTTTAVLGTSAGTTAQMYRGMPIVFTNTVTGTSFITDYTAGKTATLADTMSGAIVATTSYQIPVNVRYSPASINIPSVTLYAYRDGKLLKVTGARGTATLEFTSGGVGRMRCTFTGMFGSQTDAPVPAPSTMPTDSTRPPIWKGGRALVNRSKAAMASLSIDFGNQMTNPDNPNAAEAFDPAVITARNMTGSSDPLEELVATRDAIADFRAGAAQPIGLSYGAVAGNRVGLTIPAATYTNVQPGDRGGLATQGLQFACTGQDAGAFLTLY
ncbi:hypothetical protein GAY29_17945 [Azospirillum brasilense]|uniref:hypothetical protein n=1 Tax=Azospirillum brasilense TaxID=192 RepID=UPI0019098AF1|nr:hypothetical protein [Azospirillum brasilense]MBK3734950.1 hypothetical protein [Azospirillum brasilense]